MNENTRYELIIKQMGHIASKYGCFIDEIIIEFDPSRRTKKLKVLCNIFQSSIVSNMERNIEEMVTRISKNSREYIRLKLNKDFIYRLYYTDKSTGVYLSIDQLADEFSNWNPII